MGESLSPLSLLGIAVGLFYTVGAVLLLRALAADAVMDRMLEGLGTAGDAADRTRRRWWMPGGALLLLSGLSLLALSRWTPLAFASAGLLQAAWLLRAGRGESVGAFLLFLLAGALVWRLDQEELWRSWIEPAALELLVLASVAVAVSAMLLRHVAWRPAALPLAPPRATRRLRLRPEYRMSPLQHDDTYDPVDPAELGLTAPLVARIAAWDAGFQALFDEENPFDWRFPDLAAEQAWFEEGCAIAGAIQLEWDGDLRNDLSGLGTMIDYARRAIAQDQPTPLDEAIALAPRCGVAEIRDALQRLEIVVLAADDVAPDDAATRAALVHERRFLALVLAHVDPRYRPEVPAGLAATVAQTRAWLKPRA